MSEGDPGLSRRLAERRASADAVAIELAPPTRRRRSSGSPSSTSPTSAPARADGHRWRQLQAQRDDAPCSPTRTSRRTAWLEAFAERCREAGVRLRQHSSAAAARPRPSSTSSSSTISPSSAGTPTFASRPTRTTSRRATAVLRRAGRAGHGSARGGRRRRAGAVLVAYDGSMASRRALLSFARERARARPRRCTSPPSDDDGGDGVGDVERGRAAALRETASRRAAQRGVDAVDRPRRSSSGAPSSTPASSSWAPTRTRASRAFCGARSRTRCWRSPTCRSISITDGRANPPLCRSWARS